MSQIQIKIKGKKEITVSAHYNSLSTYTQYHDDVKFAEGSNPLKDYLYTTSCGTWQDDRIKILSLPHKGKLFYLTNPSDPTPIYAECTVGQFMIVRDILDDKVLKFQGEGFTDNAFTGTYMTTFKFERYCGAVPSNIVVHLNLSMVDDLSTPFTISETLRSENQDNCGHSYVEFEVNGDVTNMPIKLKYNGAPSGASVDIVEIGTGIGSFRYANNNAPFLGEVQEKDGSFNVFSQSDLLLTNTGTTKFRLSVMSSDTIKLPNKQLAITSCTELEGMDSSSTFASVELLTQGEIPLPLSVMNSRTVYYSAGSVGN